ncbi:uncharacterized protein PFLUO_LOCUS2188 [Penicillium psychrofluorescens]|uniref:uncharacterized protein n=1 Tax=Penicillium psychrofluorescens TaxID=3158075 RepID=UPI003CCD89FC
MPAPTNHALVFGASGISGWAVVNALLNGYPDADTFTRVTALTNRPLPQESSQWPPSEKFQAIDGIDLLAGEQADLDHALKQRVPGIDTVTHVYFFAYILNMEPQQEIQANVKILRRAVTAIQTLSPGLKFVVLPAGAKAYGIHLLDDFPFKDQVPLRESLPRIPEPFASQLFYYPQIDLLQSLSEGKSWSYCTVMPDLVVGFVPNNNFCCLAQWLALYLSLHREISGEGAEVAFPGNPETWTVKSNDSNQDVIARFSIYASLHPEISAGERFNVADSAEPSTWETKWPILCEYFGLTGVAPDGTCVDPVQFLTENKDKWFAMEAKYGLETGRVANDRSFPYLPIGILSMMKCDRQLDSTKTHAAWGKATEELDVKQSWYTAFDRFRTARIIP